MDLGVGEEGYEACDDGNEVQTDACLNNCAAAACGDGIVQVNVEACDDGNNNNDDECTNDCVVAPLGSSPARAAVSCQAIKTARPQAATGTYWINPDGEGGVAPFQVSCDMSTEGGGWLRMRLNNSNQLVAAEWGRSNPFYKCADDEARMYDWVNQTQITPDSSPGGDHNYEVGLSYTNLANNQPFSEGQMTALRAQVTTLATSTKMVATTSDDDNYSRQVAGGGGHEVYVRTAQGQWLLLTPGTNGECGGGAGSAGSGRHADHLGATANSPSPMERRGSTQARWARCQLLRFCPRVRGLRCTQAAASPSATPSRRFW